MLERLPRLLVLAVSAENRAHAKQRCEALLREHRQLRERGPPRRLRTSVNQVVRLARELLLVEPVKL